MVAFVLLLGLLLTPLPFCHSISVLWIGWSFFSFWGIVVLDTFKLSDRSSSCTKKMWQNKIFVNFWICRKLLYLLQRPAHHREQAGGGGRRGPWVWLPPGGLPVFLFICFSFHLFFFSPVFSSSFVFLFTCFSFHLFYLSIEFDTHLEVHFDAQLERSRYIWSETLYLVGR